MPTYYLFSTTGCHLCEEAQYLLDSLNQPVNYSPKDIIDDPAWSERYAIRIPVLYHVASAEELSWPFDQSTLLQFVNRHR